MKQTKGKIQDSRGKMQAGDKKQDEEKNNRQEDDAKATGLNKQRK